MPTYRYVITTPVGTTGTADTRTGILHTPDDATAVFFARAKMTDASQSLELWQDERRVLPAD